MRGDGGVGWFALLYFHFGLGHLLVVFCGFHLLWGEGGGGDRGWWRISWLYWSLQKKWKLQRYTHKHTLNKDTHIVYNYAHVCTPHTQLHTSYTTLHTCIHVCTHQSSHKTSFKDMYFIYYQSVEVLHWFSWKTKFLPNDVEWNVLSTKKNVRMYSAGMKDNFHRSTKQFLRCSVLE